MNPAQLLTHFDRISEAPDAIPRLRRFILDLAVRGKLVEQDLSTKSAYELLKRIQAEKARLVKAGDIRTQEALSPIESGEVPFVVPIHWALVRLGDALELVNGRAFKPNEWSESGLPIIRIQNLNSTDAPFNYCDALIPEKFHVKTGDFLIGWSGTPGTSFGVHIWDRGHAILNQHIFRAELISDAFLPPFLKLAINSRLLELIDQAHGGVGLQHITKPKLERLALTLPPLAEQHRIVAKVDELMALCDRLEAAQSERESRRDRLAAASLQRLNQPADAPAFSEHARFHLRHLPRLTTRPEHIKHLRETILDLATRGYFTIGCRKMVSTNQSAEAYLREIEVARRRKWDQQYRGLKRKYPDPAVITNQNLPCIPNSWIWASGDAICSQITDGEHIQPPYQAEGYPMLTATHVRNGFVTFDGCGFISESHFRKCATRCKPEKGDILVVSVGATTGRAAIVSKCPPFALVRSVLLLKPVISGEFLLRWLQSPWCFAWMRQASEASAQPHLYIGDTKRMPVPIPPPAEQEQIVAKLDGLLALCDRLAAQLTTAQSESRRLLEALLQEALNPVEGRGQVWKMDNSIKPADKN